MCWGGGGTDVGKEDMSTYGEERKREEERGRERIGEEGRKVAAYTCQGTPLLLAVACEPAESGKTPTGGDGGRVSRLKQGLSGMMTMTEADEPSELRCAWYDRLYYDFGPRPKRADVAVADAAY